MNSTGSNTRADAIRSGLAESPSQCRRVNQATASGADQNAIGNQITNRLSTSGKASPATTRSHGRTRTLIRMSGLSECCDCGHPGQLHAEWQDGSSGIHSCDMTLPGGAGRGSARWLHRDGSPGRSHVTLGWLLHRTCCCTGHEDLTVTGVGGMRQPPPARPASGMLGRTPIPRRGGPRKAAAPSATVSVPASARQTRPSRAVRM